MGPAVRVAVTSPILHMSGRLWWCSLTGAGYKDLANVLCSPRLAELELGGDNSLEDTSVQQLCKGLKHPSCRLRRLR